MPAWSEAFEAHISPVLAQEDVPGLALGIAQGGRQVYFRGFGERDRGRHLPVTEHTLFGIGSITKSFTAVAIMQLQEAGKLSVDDPVARHIPELRIPNLTGANPIRLSNLLAHTSGMPPTPALHAVLVPSLREDPDIPAEIKAQMPDAVVTWDDLIAYLNNLDMVPLAEPGRLFNYWNDGWALLGLVIERTSGTTYERYVEEHILGPAGMTESTFDIRGREDGPDTSRLFQHRKRDDGSVESYDAGPWWDAPVMTAAGFLRSTTHDMLRYMEIYRTGGSVDGTRILTEASVREMTTPRIWCDTGVMYGYGLMLSDYRGHRLVGHGGGIKGVSAWVVAVPDADVTAVGLANLTGAPTWRVVHAAMNGALGLDPATPRFAFGPYTPAAPLSDYAGTYDSGEGARGGETATTVAVEGDILTLSDENETFVLRPADADGFVMTARGDDAYVRFLRDEAGRVFAMHFGFRAVRRVG